MKTSPPRPKVGAATSSSPILACDLVWPDFMRSREGQGSNGGVSRSRWRHEDCDPQSLFRCQVARVPAPEARQKIGPGVSLGSPIPSRPKPQRGDRFQPPLLRCPIGSCRRHKTAATHSVSRRDQRKPSLRSSASARTPRMGGGGRGVAEGGDPSPATLRGLQSPLLKAGCPHPAHALKTVDAL